MKFSLLNDFDVIDFFLFSIISLGITNLLLVRLSLCALFIITAIFFMYELIDDVKAAMSGLLSPERQENFIGYAEILEVFNITKVGKIAGCKVTEGIIKRGCKVRLLRDNVVVHEGNLKTLKRFKDEVKEVREGQECGMAFENYSDLVAGDMIECFEIEEIARTL